MGPAPVALVRQVELDEYRQFFYGGRVTRPGPSIAGASPRKSSKLGGIQVKTPLPHRPVPPTPGTARPLSRRLARATVTSGDISRPTCRRQEGPTRLGRLTAEGDTGRALGQVVTGEGPFSTTRRRGGNGRPPRPASSLRHVTICRSGT